MRNVWIIFKRDILRLLKVPSAWIVIIGLTFLPCLYAWINIFGFWDPYGNTSNISVAIANEDTGTDSATLGHMDLGAQIVKKLQANHELGWRFENRADAMQCVESANCYAAIVIPKDFSASMADIVTDPSRKPTLEYYVNEKANAVAPKITGVGATTVDREVNNTFVSTVSTIVTNLVNKTNTSIEQKTDTTVSQAIDRLNKTDAKLTDTTDTINKLITKLDSIPSQTATARAAMDHVQQAADQSSSGLQKAQGLLTKSQQNLNTFMGATSKSLDKGSSLLTQATSQANTNVIGISSAVLGATGYTQSAITSLQSVNTTNQSLVNDLKNIDLSSINPELQTQLQQLITQLDTNNQQTATALSDLKTLNTNVRNTASSTQKLADSFSGATNTTITSASNARDTLSSGALPQLNSSLSSLAASSGMLAASASGANSLIAQTQAVLNQLDSVSESSVKALTGTGQLISELKTRIDSVRTDLQALTSANMLSSVLGTSSLDASSIANFMLSPTVLKTTTLYPINSYGSGMAPLFTSLSLWVGCFMLMVILKLEVDDEGLDGLYVTAAQKYWARFLFLSIIAMAQGLVCTIGDLLLGVQTVSKPMFVLTGVIISLCYLSITYALSTTFMHVGKGLVVALVMVQIPGASGLYPIEMMPKFFQVLYPFFPFTYAISAFRETIGGFYDGHWGKMILMLLLFAALGFVLGLLVRPFMTNINRLFSNEIEQGDLINGERVYLPNRPFSAATAINVLASKGAYRKQLKDRAIRFAHLYPKLLRGALIAGIAVPAILFVTFSVFNDGRKIVALAVWCVWILLIIGFLMVVEYIHDSLSRQVELSGLNDDELVNMVFTHTLQDNASRTHKEEEKQHRWSKRHPLLKMTVHEHRKGKHSA